MASEVSQGVRRRRRLRALLVAVAAWLLVYGPRLLLAVSMPRLALPMLWPMGFAGST